MADVESQKIMMEVTPEERDLILIRRKRAPVKDLLRREVYHDIDSWKVFYKHKYDEWHVGVPADGSDHATVALFPDGVPWSDSVEAEASARLIGESPELFWACWEALWWITQFYPQFEAISPDGAMHIQDILALAIDSTYPQKTVDGNRWEDEEAGKIAAW